MGYWADRDYEEWADWEAYKEQCQIHKTWYRSDLGVCPDCEFPNVDCCLGNMSNGPNKKYVRCDTCNRIDYEQNESDICGSLIEQNELETTEKKE